MTLKYADFELCTQKTRTMITGKGRLCSCYNLGSYLQADYSLDSMDCTLSGGYVLHKTNVLTSF